MQHAKFGIGASWAIALVALMSCGGDVEGGDAPSSTQIKETCVKICQKRSSCGLTFNCTEQCSGAGQIPAGCKTLSKVQACLDVACTALESCFNSAVSSCSGTGTGGSGSGTGGSGNSTGGISSGTGGAVSGDCSACTKAPACCTALAMQFGQDASLCSQSSVASCMAAAAAQATTILACQQIVQTGATLNVAACK